MPPRRRPTRDATWTTATPSMPPHARRPLHDNNSMDDDDLELPVVRSKPLSSAASIAKFHRIRSAVDDPSSARSSTYSSPTTTSTRPRKRPPAGSASPWSTGAPPSPWTTKTKAAAHQRPKYHAGKQLPRHNRLSSLVLHSVTPRESAAVVSAASLLASATSSPSFSGHFTEYDVVVENVRASQIWQVSRRFSSFVQFRKELTALFDAPHCHHCTDMNMKLDALHDGFPSKRLWGHNKKTVVAQRAQKLQQYLHGLLALAAKAHTKQCRLVATSFAMHLRGFLTVESTRFHGIPGGDFGHSIPSLLQELSQRNTGAVVVATAKKLPLATIPEHVPGSPWDSGVSIALLEKDEDAETEDEEDDSPSDDNQRDDP